MRLNRALIIDTCGRSSRLARRVADFPQFLARIGSAA
jgi:hypothetical protein